MPYAQVSNLDFDDIKVALKDYLRAQTDFTDYDFEGSTWSVLLDVLAYNTYYTAFNTNLVVNELFLDSASLRDNVVSIAKQLGYSPKSVSAPMASITFEATFATTSPSVAVLRAGSAFTTVFDGTLYQYTILDDVSAPVSNGVATFQNVQIYEGSLIKNSYLINTALKSTRYLIQNQGVDTSKLRVKVFPQQGSTAFNYFKPAANILDINSQSDAYFINEIEDENYELFFGDGILGKKLENGQFVEVQYLVSNGAATNGAKTFVFNGVIEDKNGNPFQLSTTITSVTPATGGEAVETIDKIKYNAPRFYGTQNRAVTAQDYAAIVRNIYPSVADIITYGGEMEQPPEYGKVKIVVKPSNSDLLSSFVKNEIKTELKKYMVGSVIADIIDPSILYVELTSKIFYDGQKTTLIGEEIVSKVRSTIENYIEVSNTEKFNGKFRYSKYVGVIDDADRAINSNQTSVMMRKDFYPFINSTTYYEVCFQNAFYQDCDEPSVVSTGFRISEYPDYTVYFEDRDGRIVLYRIDEFNGLKLVLNDNAGYVKYDEGEVVITDLTVIKGSFEDNKISIRVRPLSNDINALREVYLDVDMSQSKFTAYKE